MLIKCLEQIQLGVLFDLNANIVELLDRCITCEEVKRSRSEADDLQIIKTHDSSCDRLKLVDHICALFSSAHRILRYVRFHITQLQIITCIEHTAICVATPLYKVVLSLFCCCHKHFRSIKMFRKQCFRYLRAKVSKIYNKCIAPCFLDILKCLHHMDLTLHDTDRTLIDCSFTVFLLIRIDQCFSPVYRQALRETVAAYCDNSDFQFWHVVH